MNRQKEIPILGFVLTLALSCSSATSTAVKSRATEPAVIETVALKGDEVLEQTDLNHDQKADVFTIYVLKKIEQEKTERRLSRKEIDVNFDGKIDIVRFYDSAGNLSREEIDLDFDARVDIISHYKDGKVYLTEQSSTFDGRMDIKKHFENEALILKELDTNRDGKMDTFYYFYEGKLERIGYDKDGDGSPEMFDENPT